MQLNLKSNAHQFMGLLLHKSFTSEEHVRVLYAVRAIPWKNLKPRNAALLWGKDLAASKGLQRKRLRKMHGECY